jgi:PQQ-like domain
MKQSTILILLLFILSCTKNTTIIDTPAVINTQDSAKLIFIESSVPNNAGGSTLDHSVAAYTSTKNKKWELLTIDRFSAASIKGYFDNSLLIENDNDELFSINASTGSNNWSYTDFSKSLSYGLLVSRISTNDTIAIAASTGTLYNPSARNTLLLLNKQNGNVIWSKPIAEQSLIAPTLNNSKLYALTTNSTGMQTTLSAYDIVSKNLVWQKILSTSFLMSLPSDMIIKGDTLIVGSSTNTINLINKNTGSIFWSKRFNANNTYLYQNNIVYNDKNTGSVTISSLQTGNVIVQASPISFTKQDGVSYIYKDAFYNKVNDTIFCTSLLDASLKWKKAYSDGTFKKFIVIGETLYGSKIYDIYNNINIESKLMILNPSNFSVKDSIIVPRGSLNNFNIVSSSNNMFY